MPCIGLRNEPILSSRLADYTAKLASQPDLKHYKCNDKLVLTNCKKLLLVNLYCLTYNRNIKLTQIRGQCSTKLVAPVAPPPGLSDLIISRKSIMIIKREYNLNI